MAQQYARQPAKSLPSLGCLATRQSPSISFSATRWKSLAALNGSGHSRLYTGEASPTFRAKTCGPIFLSTNAKEKTCL